MVAIGLYALNAVLFGFLAFTYGRTALATKAKYPLGLTIFSVLLLLHSAGTAAFYLFLGGYIDPEVFPYMSTMATFEFVGVLALLRITM